MEDKRCEETTKDSLFAIYIAKELKENQGPKIKSTVEVKSAAANF